MKTILGRLLALRFRKKKRYRAKNGLFAIPENQMNRNQIGDISMGGLSFYYIDNGLRPKKNDYVLTLMTDGKKGSVQISCRTVSDSDTGELVYQNRLIKRRSVRFERLSLQQKRKIRELIKSYTMAHADPHI